MRTFSILTDSVFTVELTNQNNVIPPSGDEMLYENNDVMIYENNDTMIY